MFNLFKKDLILTKKDVINGKLKNKYFIVIGNVYATDIGLTTLKNFPRFVKGNVYVDENNISDLKYCPRSIGKNQVLNLRNNNISDLKINPKFDNLNLNHNNITSLKDLKRRYNNLELYNNPIKNLNHKSGLIKSIRSNLFIERNFLEEVDFTFENYFEELLDYCIKKDRHLEINWPEEFVNQLNEHYKNVFKSSEGIAKFQL